MQPNNRHYIPVEDPLRDLTADSKATKGNIIEVESIKEVRRLPQHAIPHRPSPIHKRLLASGSAIDSKRCPSPSLSGVTTHEQYFREMEAAMLSQNLNLKQHNQFLKRQIECMFQRERKYKTNLASYRDRMKQLETLNSHLNEQLHLLITSILAEIERIQALIEHQYTQERPLSKHMFELTPKHSEGASETESTIHKDLEDLKAKVKQIYEQRYTQETEAPVFHRSDYKSDHSSRNTQQEAGFGEAPQKPERRRDSEEGPSQGRPKIERGRKPRPV